VALVAEFDEAKADGIDTTEYRIERGTISRPGEAGFGVNSMRSSSPTECGERMDSG
jgi:hypothetical protein